MFDDSEPAVPESVQAYVDERLPGAKVMRRDPAVELDDVQEFYLGLRLGSRGHVTDMHMMRYPEQAVPLVVRDMVRKLEELGMETFKVAIAERTARLEAELARETDRANRAESDRDDAHRTIRALTKGA